MASSFLLTLLALPLLNPAARTPAATMPLPQVPEEGNARGGGAVAGVNHAELRAWSGTVSLRMDEEAPALKADGLELSFGLTTMRLKSGLLYPVLSGYTAEEWAAKKAEDEGDEKKKKKKKAKKGAEAEPAEPDPYEDTHADRRVVGFVFVGEGELEVRFTDAHDARSFANRMVDKWDLPVDQMRPIATGQAPFVTALEKAVVLSASPELDARLATLTPVGSSAQTLTGLGKGNLEVIAPGDFKAGFKAAETLLDDRMDSETLTDVGRDRFVIDRLGRKAEDASWTAQFLTGTRYGLVIPAKVYPFGTEEDRWLSEYVAPATGVFDTRFRSVVGAEGENDYSQRVFEWVTSEGYPPEDPTNPFSPPMPPAYLAGVNMDRTTEVRLSKNKFWLEFEQEVTLKLRAVGGPVSYFQLSIPVEEMDDGQFEVLDVRGENGERITLVDPDKEGAWKDSSGEALTGPISIVPPKPLQPGEFITIHLRSKGGWPYANITEFGEQTGGTLGLSTGLRMNTPSFTPGNSDMAFTHRVGVPVGSGLSAALSGPNTRTWEEGGLSWVEASSEGRTGMYVGQAVGNWISHEEPRADEGDKVLPAVKMHMFSEEKDTIQSFPPEVRRIVSLYQDFLPTFPAAEMEIFQAPDAWYGFVYIAPHSMVNIQKTRVQAMSGAEAYFRETPFLESGVLAHELAHQYWGHVARPSSIYEGWVNETFSETFSCLYVALAYGPDAFNARMDEYRKTWEEEIDADEYASLPKAYFSPYQPQIVYNYGPYVMHKMLRPRIGDQAFFSALDQLQSDHYEQYVIAEEVQLYFEKASGKDLTDFFDYWVWGGYIPEVSLEYTLSGGKVTGTVEADIPFGTFDVPVRISAGGKSEDVWVVVKDAQGTFEAPAPAGATIELDPDGLILANKRNVKAL